MIHHLVVPGRPRPKGDLQVGRSGRLFYSSSVKQWQRDVGVIARHRIGTPVEGPVAVAVRFTFAGLRVGPHVQAPDLDKLLRAILDALTGIAYADDRQVASVLAWKDWGEEDGVRITVAPWDEIAFSAAEEEVPLGV